MEAKKIQQEYSPKKSRVETANVFLTVAMGAKILINSEKFFVDNTQSAKTKLKKHVSKLP